MLLGENILNRKLTILHMSNICCTHYLFQANTQYTVPLTHQQNVVHLDDVGSSVSCIPFSQLHAI